MSAVVAVWFALVVVAVALVAVGASLVARSRRLAVVLMPAGALVAALSLVPLLAGEVGTDDVAAGACLDELPDAEVRDLDPVDCAVQHRAQVFDVLEMPRGNDDSARVLASKAFRICVDRLQRAEGKPWQEIDLSVQTVRPTEKAWREGERTVLCAAISRNGGPLQRQVG
jgi:hypothetical protein